MICIFLRHFLTLLSLSSKNIATVNWLKIPTENDSCTFQHGMEVMDISSCLMNE